MKRYAVVVNADGRKQLEAYLPDNYSIVGEVTHEGRAGFVIVGEDKAGWTLGGYVIPRLGSGLIWATEIDLSHEVMQQVDLHELADAAGPKVHRFLSTGEAYDMSQCDDSIKSGDVLVVESEKAVAILLEAWPVALHPSSAGGAFHAQDGSLDWSKVLLTTGEEVSFSDSVRVAEREWEVISG